MAVKLQCPDSATLLRLFGLGGSPEEMEGLAQHVERCARCGEQIDELVRKDELAQGLARSVEMAGARDSEALTKLRQRLGQLRPPALSDKTTDTVGLGTTSTSGSTPPAAQPMSPTKIGLNFLAPAQQPDEIGRLGPYRVLKKLGAGGMGMVLLAEDTMLKRKVALKVMLPTIAADTQARERFLREARAAAAIEHPHIITIHQVGEDNGVPYLAMPLLKGESLEDRLAREKKLPINEAIRITCEMAEGLAAAHAEGLIHRDIKPGNVWLENRHKPRPSSEPRPSGSDAVPPLPDGRGSSFHVKLLDFGLARSLADDTHLTQSGAIVGTPAYMAPEQARGMNVDARADLFSLGCVLYAMLTGQRPFVGANTMALLTALALDTPKSPREINPAVPAVLSDFTMRLLAKDPDNRPASAYAALDELRTLVRAAAEAKKSAQASPLQPATVKTSIKPPVRPAPAAILSSARSPRRRIAILVGLALFAAVLAAAFVVIRIATNKGELVVEVDDPDVEVSIKQDGVSVEDRKKDRKFVLKAKDGEVEFYDPGTGVRLLTKEFTLERGGTTTVRASAKEFAGVRKPAKAVESTTEGPDRRAAEWALSIGGIIRINVQGKEPEIKAVADLPSGALDLSFVELNSIQKVSEPGLANFKGCKNLTHLNLGYTPVSDAGLANFKDCKSLTALILNGNGQVSDAGVANFKDCKNLTTLNLNDTRVSDIGLAYFKDCKDLTGFFVGRTKVSDAGLGQFKGSQALTQFSVSGTKVTDIGMAQLKECKNLIGFDLSNTQVGDAGLAHFKDCKNLKWLILFETQVSDAGIAHFKNYKDLNYLGLKKTKVTAAKVEELKKALPKCQFDWSPDDPDRRAAEWVLSIGGRVGVYASDQERDIKEMTALPPGIFQLRVVHLHENKQVSDAGLVHLKDCKNLTGLVLNLTQVSDSGLAHLKDTKNLTQLRLHCAEQVGDTGLACFKDAKNLRVLDLAYTKVSDRGLSYFMDCKNLVQLGLWQTSITDAGLAHFKDTKNLTNLDLNDTKIGDKGLANFRECKNMVALLLRGTQVSDTSLAILKEYKNLGHLNLQKTKVTAATVEELKKALPKCTIEWDGGVIEPKK